MSILKTSRGNLQVSQAYVYQLNTYYCIAFDIKSMPLVVQFLQNNTMKYKFNNKFVCGVEKSKIILTTNSDYEAACGLLFIADMTLSSPEHFSSSKLFNDLNLENLLALQNDYTCEVKLLRDLNSELKKLTSTTLGWKSIVCKWERNKPLGNA